MKHPITVSLTELVEVEFDERVDGLHDDLFVDAPHHVIQRVGDLILTTTPRVW